MSPLTICKYFDIDVIDYRRGKNLLLVGSGCGIMMGIMDRCPKVGFCFDADTYRKKSIDWNALGRALSACSGVDGVYIGGWFTIDEPIAMQQLAGGLNNRFLGSYAGIRHASAPQVFRNQSKTLEEFIDRINGV